MKLIPKRFKKRLYFRKDVDGVPLSGKKGGRVKKQIMEARLIDKELQNYAYR